MGTREVLISELGFLDEASFVMDEKPKSKDSIKKKPVRNEEVREINLDKALLKAIEGMSDDAALAVIRAVKKIPSSIKKAVGSVYDSLGSLGDSTGTEDVKKCLTELKTACGDKYKSIYDKTVKDVKKTVSKIQTRLFSNGLD